MSALTLFISLENTGLRAEPGRAERGRECLLLRASRASFCSHSNKLFLVLTWQPGSLDPNEVRAKGPRADAVQTLSLSGPDLEQVCGYATRTCSQLDSASSQFLSITFLIFKIKKIRDTVQFCRKNQKE